MAENLKKGASENAYILLIDETGLQLAPLRRRSWAKRGCRPILKQMAGPRQKLSIISALSISPVKRHCNLYFRSLLKGSFNSDQVAEFLRELLKQIPGKIIVVWDNGRMHTGPAIRDVLKRHRRLTIERLPPYAPELNPVEMMWSHLKYGYCANLIPRDLEHLDDVATDFLIGTKHEQNTLQSYFKQTPLDDAIRKMAA